MSEDEDYMSDKFLSGADVRPSLIKDRARKRELEVSARQAAQIKRQKEERLERNGATSNEKLQESLKRPIEADNKGFQLLAKMGYKPGQALGKHKEKDATVTSTAARTIDGGAVALTEPIGISIKSGRGGLGRETALRELTEKRRQLRQQRLLRHAGSAGTTLSTEEFRKRNMERAEERFTKGALARCQLTCENLDTELDLQQPEISWFWPQRQIDTDEKEECDDTNSQKDTQCSAGGVEADVEEEDEDAYTNTEKLEMLTSYMRTSYMFCFWCGVRYKDAQDLGDNCPGLTRDEH